MVKLVLDKFPTHVAYTENKKAPDKYTKVNNQSIYNGKINRFSRNTAVRNLHSYVEGKIPSSTKLVNYPLKIKYLIRTVKNHGSISRRNGKIIWKPAKKDYVPTWDIDNLAFLWIKTINDTLTKKGVIIDDNVNYVISGCYEVEFVDDLEDREIIVTFTV